MRKYLFNSLVFLWVLYVKWKATNGVTNENDRTSKCYAHKYFFSFLIQCSGWRYKTTKTREHELVVRGCLTFWRTNTHRSKAVIKLITGAEFFFHLFSFASFSPGHRNSVSQLLRPRNKSLPPWEMKASHNTGNSVPMLSHFIELTCIVRR